MDTGGGETFTRQTSWWGAVSTLLDWWQATGEPDPRESDDTVEAWLSLELQYRSLFVGLAPSPRLGSRAAAALNDAMQQGPLAAHAAAWAADCTRYTYFNQQWAGQGPTRLSPGALFPVGEWDTDRHPLQERLSHPWQTYHQQRELPHVRRHQPSDLYLDVEFDTTQFHDLAFVADARTFAAGLPNADLEDFDIPHNGFPIACKDGDVQRSRVLKLVTEAIEQKVDVLVLPELAAEDSALDEIKELSRTAERLILIVPGSCHVVEDGGKRNAARLVTPSGTVLTHHKRVRFWGADVREGIDECDEPLRLIVAGDLRILILICKDLLTTRIVQTAARYGANLVLVPSMSPTLAQHDPRARDLAVLSHALTFVANGPPGQNGVTSPALLAALPESDPHRAVSQAGGEAHTLVVWELCHQATT